MLATFDCHSSQHHESAARFSTTSQHHESAPPFSNTGQHHASAPRCSTTLAHRERWGGGGGGNAATNQAGSCPTSTLLVAVSISRSAASLPPELRSVATLIGLLASMGMFESVLMGAGVGPANLGACCVPYQCAPELGAGDPLQVRSDMHTLDRKSTRLNSSHW